MQAIRSFLALTLCVIAGLATHPAAAMEWHKDAEKAATKATKNSLPMTFLVLPSRDAVDDPAAAIPSLADPTVAQILERHFVNVILKPGMTTKIMLEQFGAPDAAARTIIVATFKGEKMGMIAPETTNEPTALAEALVRQYQTATKTLFSEQLASQLAASKTQPDKALEALDTVTRLLILQADQAVAAIIKDDDADKQARQKACKSLAVLSTPRGVKSLLQAADQLPAAADALSRCAPPAASTLLGAITSTDESTSAIAIKAIAAICGMGDAPSVASWNELSAEDRDAEIGRLQAKAAQRLAAWQKGHRLHAMLLAAVRDDQPAAPAKKEPNKKADKTADKSNDDK